MTLSFNFNRAPRRNYFYNSQTDARVPAPSNIFVGIVKANNDAQSMGRLAVWIPELGGDPDDEQHWLTVSYASPFAGVTSPNSLVKDGTDMASSQQAYGFWMMPPDLENHVLCCFANGNMSMGYWFACLWQQNMNHAVPGIPSNIPTDQQKRAGSYPPVTEYNKWSDENPDSPKRPPFTPLDQGLSNQGLYTDPERGPSTSGARREAPSLVYGWLTPRGNSVHVDDNPANEFIRLRTRSGAQVLINETSGYVYINSKNGNSWAEISDAGVDIYSTGAISLRSEGSLNLKSDASLNIEAVGNLNLRAGGNLTIQSAYNTDIAGNGRLALQFGGVVSAKGGSDILLDSSGNLRLGASADITQSSAGNNVRSAANIYDNTSPSAPAPNAPGATVAKLAQVPDVTGTGPAYTTSATTQTIVTRMPTHEPYVKHPNSADPSTSYPLNPSPTEYASASDIVSVPSTNVVASTLPANFTDDDLTWLTVCIFTEAGGLSDDMMAGVGYVVMNRVATNHPVSKVESNWGPIKKQVLSHYQFSFFNSPTAQQTEAIGIAKIEKEHGNSTWTKCNNIAKQCIAGTYASSPVAPIKSNRRCIQYLNLPYTEKHYPNGSWKSWAVPRKFVCTLGTGGMTHSFYTA